MDLVREEIQARLSRFSSMSYHLGGARMAENPPEDVVDTDCLVQAVHNLFVAGSAIFVTFAMVLAQRVLATVAGLYL